MAAHTLLPERPPLIVFEDEHLLVVNKPSGLNTHSPSPFAGEGIYDWLRHREPRWATLATIHRLDKETSGVLVFAKTAQANRSLTQQFAGRTIRKKYVLLTDRPVQRADFTALSALVRSGEKYFSRPLHAGAAPAETRFHVLSSKGGLTLVEAEPLTGRTHQIRVHAAEQGFPIFGDTLYGGTPAARLFLHAEELILKHPVSGAEMSFRVPADFSGEVPRFSLRAEMIDPEITNAYRLVHGASDGWPGWYVDRLGPFLLSQSEQPLAGQQMLFLQNLLQSGAGVSPAPQISSGPLRHPADTPLRGAYHKTLRRTGGASTGAEACPQHILGETSPECFRVRENGLEYELRFGEGCSVGLFLDQRDNRRRLLANHVAANFPLFPNSPVGAELLNLFAYTCGFSVCAAKAGARTTSIDLSKKYLEWGRRNFVANRIDPREHEFLSGDAFDWLRRLLKKKRLFDVIVLDPPTFSRSKEHGPFRVEKDCGKLVLASLPLLRPKGVVFASTNAATWGPEEFLAELSDAVRSAKRTITQQHYVPQPPDFPISRMEPAYLKTVWMRFN